MTNLARGAPLRADQNIKKMSISAHFYVNFSKFSIVSAVFRSFSMIFSLKIMKLVDVLIVIQFIKRQLRQNKIKEPMKKGN